MMFDITTLEPKMTATENRARYDVSKYGYVRKTTIYDYLYIAANAAIYAEYLRTAISAWAPQAKTNPVYGLYRELAEALERDDLSAAIYAAERYQMRLRELADAADLSAAQHGIMWPVMAQSAPQATRKIKGALAALRKALKAYRALPAR